MLYCGNSYMVRESFYLVGLGNFLALKISHKRSAVMTDFDLDIFELN